VTLLGIVLAAITAAGLVAAGQTGDARPASKNGARTPVPRTPWGHPDLQGTWSNATTTPLERPADLSAKATLSADERARLDREVQARRNTDQAPSKGDPGTYNEFWWERGSLLHQTALIVNPPDGRVPALTAEGSRRVAAYAAAVSGHGPADTWADRNLHERCILYHGVPPLPTGYNNNYEIVQTPAVVAIRYEMLTETRFIPLDGRPHVHPNVKLWMGDPRGRWDGDTLVVESTNFNEAAGGLYELGTVMRLRGVGETMKIVERFTRTGKDTIDYRFTIDDPKIFTQPWTGTIPLTRLDERIFEYACHEGNYAMEHMLAGARVEEARRKASQVAR
jgi:hypothetical protein